MNESVHADWLRELGYTDFGTEAVRGEITCGSYQIVFTLDGQHRKKPIPLPCFFITEVILHGNPLPFSIAVDELCHQWAFFSDIKPLKKEYLTDVGFTDVGLRVNSRNKTC